MFLVSNSALFLKPTTSEVLLEILLLNKVKKMQCFVDRVQKSIKFFEILLQTP